MDILWIWSIWWFSHIYSTCIVWFPFPILHLHHWNQPSFFPRIPGPESAKPPIWSLAEGCWERSWVMMMMMMMMMIAGMTLAIVDTSLVCLKFVKQLAPGKAPVLRARVNEVTCAWAKVPLVLHDADIKSSTVWFNRIQYHLIWFHMIHSEQYDSINMILSLWLQFNVTEYSCLGCSHLWCKAC